MNSEPPPEAPEYRGKTLSPVSPKPLHVPSPSNIPVLENQMDPVFNDTTTHMGPSANPPPVPTAQSTDQSSESNPRPMSLANGSDVSLALGDSAYGGQDAAADGATGAVPSSSHLNDAKSNLTSTDTSSTIPAGPGNSDAAGTVQDTLATLAITHAGSIDSSSQAHETTTAVQTSTQGEADAAPQSHGFAQADTSSAQGGGVDLQALLANISSSAVAAQGSPEATATANLPTSFPTSEQTSSTTPPGSSATTSAAGLPPRPPPQEQPTIHPNYTHSSDIRAYHPHNQPPALTSSYTPQPNPAFAPGTYPPPALSTGAPGTNGLPPPPVATFQQPAQGADPLQLQSPQEPALGSGDVQDGSGSAGAGVIGDERPWGPDVQKKYDEFLQNERHYVTEGRWDKFPDGSRLFIGNLPTEKVTKRDLFHVFHKYGVLAQISLKQAYGFVQFLDSQTCLRALRLEQGVSIRGRKLHLEQSRPQNKGAKSQRHRSRSPDYSRGGNAPSGTDRYVGGRGERGPASPRDRNRRRGRDDYRPGRSPSPRGYRGRDDFRRGRSPDVFNGRRNSRSRSPYSRKRFRSRSPHDSDDDLPLPRRLPRDVPDVQILVLEDLNPEFIAWIEKAFHDRRITVNVVRLGPRLSESAVVRRQIMEGVQAVSRLRRVNQQKAKMPLQVFDRSQGTGSVRFDEYVDLDPHICAELVVRAKQAQTSFAPHAQQGASYGNLANPGYGLGVPPNQPQYGGYPQQPQPQPQPAANAPIGNIINSLDNQSLSKLLATMQPSATSAQQQHPQHVAMNAAAGLNPHLANLLPVGAAAAPAHHHHQQQQQPPQYANLAGLLGSAAPAAQQSQPQPHTQQRSGDGAPNMQEIMAQLAKYQR